MVTNGKNEITKFMLNLLIGQKATRSEVDLIRQDLIDEFNQNPIATLNDVQQIEPAMTQIPVFSDIVFYPLLVGEYNNGYSS